MNDGAPAVRKGQGSTKLTKEEFRRRLRERFYDPAFETVAPEIDRVIDVALDRDAALLEEVRNAARSLLEAVKDVRSGRKPPDHAVRPPRPK